MRNRIVEAVKLRRQKRQKNRDELYLHIFRNRLKALRELPRDRNGDATFDIIDAMTTLLDEIPTSYWGNFRKRQQFEEAFSIPESIDMTKDSFRVWLQKVPYMRSVEIVYYRKSIICYYPHLLEIFDRAVLLK